MYKSSRKFLGKLISGYPFVRSSKPISSFHLNLISLKIQTSNFHNFSSPLLVELARPNHHYQTRRNLSYPESSFDKNKVIDEINLKFAEARDEIESAMESKETVYFDEEAECARAAVKDCLEMFDGLLEKLPEEEKKAVLRSMGLKMEQLKGELQQLELD